MTRSGFKLAVVTACSLALTAMVPTVLFCVSSMQPYTCIEVDAFVSWAGGAAIFVFFIFVLIPLLVTFVGIPYMRQFVPKGRSEFSSAQAAKCDTFFEIVGWVKHE